MTETAVATDVHETLDVHGQFATQVTFDGDLAHLVPDFFQVGVGQFLDLLIEGNAGGRADLLRGGTADAVNVRQANFSVLVRGNVDASNTCPSCPLIP